MKVGNIEVLDLRQELPAGRTYGLRTLADIGMLVFHHSGVDVDSTAWQVASYHRDVLGWPGIGYHFLVHWDGRVEYAGDILTIRYHASSHNKEAIGICLTGNFDMRPPGREQLLAARDLAANLSFALGRQLPILGHHELAATACPGNTFMRKEPYWHRWIKGVLAGGNGERPPGDEERESSPNPIGGIHWRNDPWRVEEDDFRRFALGKFDWVATICFPNLPPEIQAKHIEVYRRLRRISPRLKFLVRLNLSGPAKSSDFVAAFAPLLEELREFTDLFQIHNEPNHPGEHFGGASDDSAWRYRWWHQRVVEGLKQAAPWAKLGFPGLAVMQREEEWLEICSPAIEQSDFLGCHVYWQYDNWASVDWGGRYALFTERFPDKDLYITEYGDATPGRSPSQKARVYSQWLRTVQASTAAMGHLKAACAFILSSPDPAWSAFVLDEEACQIMGNKE